MNATVHERGQMVIPAKARKQARIFKGDVLSIEIEGDGRLRLVRMERSNNPLPAKVEVTYRKGTHAVATTSREITSAQVRALLDEP